MYKINNIKHCNIFNNSFFQDLEQYRLIDDINGDTYIKYESETGVKPVSVRMEAITGLIDNSVDPEVWTPVLITGEKFLANKPFFGKQQIHNNILGVENAVSFESKFKNWNTELPSPSGTGFKSIDMSSNWFVSTMSTTIKPEYGLLFWYKKNSAPYSSRGTLDYQDIPISTIISWTGTYTYKGMNLSSGDYGVKINDKTISLLNKKSALIQNSNDPYSTGLNVSFNSEIQTINIGSQPSGSHYYVLTKGIKYIPENSNTPPSFYDLWIPDGECFSYYETEIASIRSKTNLENSNTYLSPSLYPVYREIYHTLTLRRLRGSAYSYNKKQSLALQKLCYFLSSSPIIDRTTINILNDDEIYNAVTTYINLDITDTGDNTDIKELKKILNIIFNKYKKISYHIYKRHNRNNYIQSKLDLVKKLLGKYPPYLSIVSDIGLSLKKPISNGPHAFLSLSSIGMYDKNIPATSSIYNNSSIEIGNIKYLTDITTSGSVINIRANNFATTGYIPLADISLRAPIADTFYLGSGIRISNFSNQSVIKGYDVNPSPGSEDYSYLWEKISGPNCLKFKDINKAGIKAYQVTAYPTSSDPTPDIHIFSTGTYEIKATRTTTGGVSQSDILKITTSDTEPLNSSITPPAPSVNNKIINGVFKQVAFNKRGLLWIVDSDNYYDDGETNEVNFDRLNVTKLRDVQLDFNIDGQEVTLMNQDANLKLSFYPNNTKILLLSIQIENMRDRDNKYSQCKSFFKEQVVADKKIRLADNVELGASSYVRKYRDTTTFYYHDSISTNGRTNSKVSYTTPLISTTLSPQILPYGGYDTKVVDNLGIKISGHPQPESLEMPILLSRNNFYLIPGTGKYCHLKEVLPTGDGHYVDFRRGHFHPSSGWIKDNGSFGYLNQSCVISNNLDRQKSFAFSGPGLMYLKPSMDGQNLVHQSTIIINENLLTSDIAIGNKYGFDSIKWNNLDYDNLNSSPNIPIQDESRNNLISDGCLRSSITYGIPTTGISHLVIKDLEVKLNFLNYVNPKNLVVWLDVKNPRFSRDSLPNDNKFFIKSNFNGFTNNSQANMYLSALGNMNTGNAIPSNGTARLYLLNQENISNYNTNFSFKFSDHADKYISTSKSIDNNYIKSPLKEQLNNYGIIQPTVVATGYNDIDSQIYSSIIKTNNINTAGNSFLKFYNIPLTGTEFTINFSFIDPIDYTNTILDNLLINDSVAGLSSTENKHYSSSVSDSLCSWEIIVHTDDIHQPIAKDILGYIDYSAFSPVNPYNPSSGVNFIGDFTNKNYLIPSVNINAPYPYFANINTCFNCDPDMYRGISSQIPTFPSLLPYAMIGLSAMSLGLAGVVGGLQALAMVSSFMSNGGRADPIINYFTDVRFFNQTIASDAQYYKPIYSNLSFGDANTAIVCASNNGAEWYYFETPIFRYINTPPLSKNKYKFIKLAEKNIPQLSHFNYTIINTYNDLKLSSVIQSTTFNIEQLSGTGIILSDMAPFYKNDIVYVKNQTEPTQNGYYVVKETAWDKIPISINPIFLQNNYDPSWSEQDIVSDTNDKKEILVDGTRAFDFFDVSQYIKVSTIDDNSVYIKSKHIISTVNGYKTLFVLSAGVGTNGYITKPSGVADTLFLYRDDTTTRSSEKFPINSWAFSNSLTESFGPINPESHITTYSEGSIGWGTDLLIQDKLYTVSPDYSKIQNTKDIFNNQINDRLKFNHIDIIDNIGTVYPFDFTEDPNDPNKDQLRGWSYTKNDLRYIFESTDDVFSKDKIENQLIKNLRSTSFADKSEPVMVCIKSIQFTGIPFSGEIYIENDYTRNSIINFSPTDKDTIRNRLDLLCTGIIPSSLKYYNNLSNDPASCLNKQTYDTGICLKMEAKQTLVNLTREKTNLQMALSLCTTSDEIMPYISGSIVVNTGPNLPPEANTITVSYKENRDLYWIHIDPEKPCRLAEEISIKIPYKTSYEIGSIVGNVVGDDSQILPPINANITNGIDENFERVGSTVTYTTSDAKIAEKIAEYKTLYPNIIWSNSPALLWDKSENLVYGDLNLKTGASKKLIISLGDNVKDNVIQMREEYIRPLGSREKSIGNKKIKDVLNLTNNLKIKFRNMPRKIKSIDSERYTKYTFDKKGNLVKPPGSTYSSVGQLANNFVCWQCIDPAGKYVIPSDFMVLQNEMLYRGFFGSIDGIEHKNTRYMDTLEAWEWIPYEYYIDTRPNIQSGIVPCGNVQSIIGSGLITHTYPVPADSGWMTLSWDASTKPDKFTIEYNGSEQFNSQYVSNIAYYTFLKPSGIDEVKVNVNGGGFGTNWKYILSCPSFQNQQPYWR